MWCDCWSGAWENPPNLGHGCGFSAGDFELTHTCTCPTHTQVPARVCKPMTGPSHHPANLFAMNLNYSLHLMRQQGQEWISQCLMNRFLTAKYYWCCYIRFFNKIIIKSTTIFLYIKTIYPKKPESGSSCQVQTRWNAKQRYTISPTIIFFLFFVNWLLHG